MGSKVELDDGTLVEPRRRVVDLRPHVREGDALAHSILIERDARSDAHSALDLLFYNVLDALDADPLLPPHARGRISHHELASNHVAGTVRLAILAPNRLVEFGAAYIPIRVRVGIVTDGSLELAHLGRPSEATVRILAVHWFVHTHLKVPASTLDTVRRPHHPVPLAADRGERVLAKRDLRRTRNAREQHERAVLRGCERIEAGGWEEAVLVGQLDLVH